jgi:hypothetical protein
VRQFPENAFRQGWRFEEEIFSLFRLTESLQRAKKRDYFWYSIRYIDEAQDGQKWRFSA